MKIKVIIFIIATLMQSLLGMKSIMHNPIATDDIYKQLALHYFGHDSICALALVNKEWNSCIQQTAQYRRRYLSSQEKYQEIRIENSHIYRQTTWHKHGSAYAYWIESNDDCSKDKKQIILYLVHLGNNKFHTRMHHCPAHHACQPKPEMIQKPFFNHRGTVDFYIFQSTDAQVIHHVLGTKKLYKILRCFVDIIHNNAIAPLGLFENYPILFQAIIDSKYISTDTANSTELYHIDGIKLDEDYLLNGSFPRLPKERGYINEFEPEPNHIPQAQKAFISRCVIKNGKLFLLLCAQYDNTHNFSLLPHKIIKNIISFLFDISKKYTKK